MKFLHISDLHIGKRVNEFSMIEDQKYILNQILRIAEQERAEAVLIAGDVYDKSMPSAEAVQMFDVAFSRLMCCSRIWSDMRSALLPRRSTDTPMMRPGMLRLKASRVAM